MSERDGANDVATFIELIDRETEQRLDPGIRRFDTMTVETEDFINQDGGVMSSRLEVALQELDNEWEFHRDIATLTGRLYLADRALMVYAVKTWGDVSYDEDGEPYFMVDDIELRSQGIVRGPHDYSFSDIPAIEHRVRMGYGFSLPHDDYDMHQFVLYPGEASQHAYGTPTPEAIDLRLHRDYPQVMELVDKLIAEGEREADKLPKRLELLTRRIQPELMESEDLREWLAGYLDRRIAFDQRWSVAVTIQGPLTFVDEDGDLLSLDVKSPHTEHTFAPEVAFVMSKTESGTRVHAALVAHLSHPADEHYTEQAIIPVTSISALRNTRRTTSLVTVAMNARYASEPDEQPTQVEQVVVQPDRKAESMSSRERLRAYQEVLDELVDETIRKRGLTYLTREAAQLASDVLCERAAEKLRNVGAHEMMVFLRGQSVTFPNFAANFNPSATGMNITPHPDIPLISPTVVGEYAGLFCGIHAAIDTFETEDGEVYLPIPKLYYALGSIQVELYKDPVALIEGPLTWRAAVRMDSLDALSVAQLEQIDDSRRAKREFDSTHPRHRLGGLIDRLGRIEVALSQEDASGFSDLRDVSALRAIGRAIDNDPEVGSDGLIVLSKMFKLATAKITGDVHHEDRLIPDYELGGTIESFVQHVPGVENSGAAIVMHVSQDPSQPVYYIPLRTITSFRY